MFYFLHGDSNKTFKKSREMTRALLKKKPDAVIFKINSENFSEDKMVELMGGQGLFENKYIVTISRLLDSAETANHIMEILSQIKASDNIFIWVEENVKKNHLNKIVKESEKTEFFDHRQKPKQNSDIFKIADLFAQKDKKQLWLKYTELIQHVPAEEIYGILWWQTKSILIAQKASNAKDAGMKDFLYKKAKNYGKNFNENEFEKIAFNLIKVRHQSRSESEDLAINLEKFILEY